MKWSNSFPNTEYYLGIIIIPNQSIDKISIKMKNDCFAKDFLTILIFVIFFVVCILLCILTLICTKACGEKDSNSIVINKNNSVGLVQNELVN